MSEFDNKTAVVTGAAGALGRAVADIFHESGARVIGVDVVPFEAAYEIHQADLIDPEGAKQVVKSVGAIDILANVAGGFTMGDSVADTSDDTWDFMFNLNARTVLNMARAVVPHMVERKSGKIINIGARAGLRGSASMAAYAASKSVVIRLTESLADELKATGVNVNCILPSIINTERNRADMPNANFSQWVAPGALAKVVHFLASEAADPIHGAAIPVEGLS
ncbi:MAG: SDR family NAD(P)-dependent oxidoreductase [Pseudomonadota bacterium]|nr:SDR family NAD(P)-dependent oxidoreductase [Pseudomonadota bacterium]